MKARPEPIALGGPFFEQLAVGQVSAEAPSLTLTAGHAAVHQAILGDRLKLALDAELSAAVLGDERMLAHPGLVWDVAIGQSTTLTQRVIGNLFYRGLVFRRAPLIGDTLSTSTEVVALRQNAPRPGRAATGMAVLRVRTVDQERRPVLDFWRCAMLPLADPAGETGHGDALDAIPAELDAGSLGDAIGRWRLDRFGPGALDSLVPGTVWRMDAGDVVSGAPELARMTLNVATAHHDQRAAGHRLVYGGHTIGLATSQLTRVLPDLVTIVAWHGCDHTGPVYEGDTLTSKVTLQRAETLASGDGGLLHLRVQVSAWRDGDAVPVLDWRPVGVVVRSRLRLAA